MIFPRKAGFCVLFLFLALIVSCSNVEVEHEKPRVYIKKTSQGYSIIRNNSPFEMRGASGNAYFHELKAAGATTIRIYDTTNLGNYLDKADSLGLAVVADIPIPRFIEPDTIYSDLGKIAEIRNKVRMFVDKHKDHPALLYWILGNELNYPDFPGDAQFIEQFNSLVVMIHAMDPNHPVSTAVGGFNRSRILSMNYYSKGLDLISINIFGELSTFRNRRKMIEFLWNGPYVFSEFGINGPWEAETTSWKAPLEETSTKKAEQYRLRYQDYINTVEDGRLLGFLGFYWGFKQERTHTWFSLFSEDGKRTQPAFEIENIWKRRNREFNGPKLNYLLLNKSGARDNIIVAPNEICVANLVFLEESFRNEFRTSWEIRLENWNYGFDEIETKPKKMEGLFLDTSTNFSSFHAPLKEGPYRIYVRVDDDKGYFATANVPFYVLNPNDDQ